MKTFPRTSARRLPATALLLAIAASPLGAALCPGEGIQPSPSQPCLDPATAPTAVAAPAQPAPNGGKAYPAHWGEPPRIQTRDLRPLPGGYGQGSGTLARWIQENLDADAKDPNRAKDAGAANPDLVIVKAAMEAWAKAKEASGGNYSYTVGFQSAFGFGQTTTLVVAGNKVVERRFEEFNRNEPPQPPDLNQGAAPPNGYLEKGAAVGKNPKGAPALTLDQVYADALKIASLPLPENERRFVRVNKEGLLLSCFTVDRRIRDNAPIKGIHLDTITLAPAKKAEGQPSPAAPAAAQADLAPKVHSGHFVSNQYRAQEALSLAVFTTLDEFNKAFGTAAFGLGPARARLDYVDATSFANGRVVAALIRRDHTPHKYTLDNASLTDEGELLLQLRSEGQPSPDATFASPLVVSLAPAGAKTVRFVENGAQVGKVAVPKLEAAPQVIEAANPGKAPARKPFPAHWGEPPLRQTRDLRPLPGGYGQGSGTLANWIQQNLDADAKDPDRAKKAPNVEPPKNEPPAKGKGPARKPFPAHWGPPPRIQTMDIGPLPGGYGQGSSTLRNWIQKNLDADAKDPNRGKQEPQKNTQAEIERVQKRIAEIEDLMKRARFTKEGFEKISAELKDLKVLLIKLQSDKERAPANPATPEPPKAQGGASPQAEIAAIEKRIVAIHSLKQIARFTPQGLAKIDAELATLEARLAQLRAGAAPDAPAGQPERERPPISAAFAKLHPAGSYAPGELLVGLKPDVDKADAQKALTESVPGLTVVTTLVNDTIFHVRLPADTNVEQAMARLKAAPCVRYSELNQIVSIPAPVRER